MYVLKFCVQLRIAYLRRRTASHAVSTTVCLTAVSNIESRPRCTSAATLLPGDAGAPANTSFRHVMTPRALSAGRRLSAGAGSKGHRMYSWLLIDIASSLPGHEWIMLRRNDCTGELADYRCWAPHLVPLRTLVGVAGRRWTVEEL